MLNVSLEELRNKVGLEIRKHFVDLYVLSFSRNTLGQASFLEQEPNSTWMSESEVCYRIRLNALPILLQGTFAVIKVGLGTRKYCIRLYLSFACCVNIVLWRVISLFQLVSIQIGDESESDGAEPGAQLRHAGLVRETVAWDELVAPLVVRSVRWRRRWPSQPISRCEYESRRLLPYSS